MLHNFTEQLLSFIDKSPTMFHATSCVKDELEANGFSYLDSKTSWKLTQGGKYYTTTNDSALIAFTLPEDLAKADHFKIVGAHTDVPGFRIKPNAQMTTESYVKLNTEIYGGPIVNTWLDRPLSVAGRVTLKSATVLTPDIRLVDLEKPYLIIPNLAIHMNREVNNGVKLNAQKETLPILTYIEEKLDDNLLLNLVAENLQVAASDILDMDLFLYPTEKSSLVGLNEEFISASRLDDLSMVYSGLKALLTSDVTNGINMLAIFDNEEVGSTSKQGANSPFLGTTIERILLALGQEREAYFTSIAKSFLISADVAHLMHPNYPEKSDPTNKVLPGKGPAIKLSASCSYTTDSDSFGVFANLCALNNIPYQVFVNRSDERGGSTIGPVTASHIAMRSLDIGTPMLSMHSARELMTVADFDHTTSAMHAFYAL